MNKTNNISGISFLFLCVFLTTTVCSSALESKSRILIHEIEDIYENVVNTYHDEFKFTKLISKKHDKLKFLNYVFQTKKLSGANRVEHSDILILLPDAKGPLHLSIVVVSFDSDQKTNDVFNLVIHTHKEYFDETKILTKYKAYKKQNDIIYVYSETFDAEPIAKVFNKITSHFSQ